jgi:hypothetical protein
MPPGDRAPESPRLAVAAEEADPRRDAAGDVERTLRTCPVCGGELAERRCKLYCPRPGCGYFLSCADYY